MSAELVCLTLIAARSLRDELFDYLDEQCDLVPGFTASDVGDMAPTFDCRHRLNGLRAMTTSSWYGQFFRRKMPHGYLNS